MPFIDEKNTRNSNVELLRILLMYAILLWHVFVHGGSISQMGTQNYECHTNTPIELCLCCILCIAVDCFIFISGYYGIKFKWRTLVSYLLMGMFWSLITFSIAIISDNTALNSENIYKAFCPFTSKLWWFFTYYILLYLFSPIINSGLDYISEKRQYNILLIILYVIGYLYHLIIGKLSLHSGISQPFNMLFVYVLGRYMRKFDLHLSWRIFALSEVLLLCSILLLYTYQGNSSLVWHFYTNGNPLVIIAATSLFFIFSTKEFHNKAINTFSKSIFAIYLATDALYYFSGGGGYVWLYNLMYANIWRFIVILLLKNHF